MVPTIEEVKTRLTTLGYEATEADDAFITFAIGKTEERIKAFTGLSDVPEGLKYEFIDEVASGIIQSKMATGGGDIDKVVKSIQEGDTTVSFDGSSSKTVWLTNYLNGMMISLTVLCRYRVFVW
mgnify:CR=1 FL=1